MPNYKCKVCKESHPLYRCEEFLKKSTSDRFKFVRDANLCINCLQPGHSAASCHSSKCRKCHKPHHTVLHFERIRSNSENVVTSEGIAATNENTVANCSINKNNSISLLCTAMVTVLDQFNKKRTCRALLNSGSQSNFIKETVVNKLGLKKHNIRSQVSGISKNVAEIKNCVKVNINSRVNQYSTEVSCLILKHITNDLPQYTFDCSNIKIPENVMLADETFNECKEIDLLLGADVFWKVMLEENTKLSENQMRLQNTKLGWIVSGTIPVTSSNVTLVSNLAIEDQLQKFWKVEEFEEKTVLTSDEESCEALFKESIKRNAMGRFIVSLPLKSSVEELGNSKPMAMWRFFALENRLNKNPKEKKMYADFMKEYIELNHMEEDRDPSYKIEYFLPHHHVMREDSATTKLRVVFDASARTTSNVSLNDLQHAGPVVQSDLFSILLNFRKHKFIATADVEKMYRQILLNKEHQNLQKIVWREERSEKIKTYKLLTVTYGMKSAPYLATRCLNEIAMLNKGTYPVAAQIIQNDMYVDDLLRGSDSEVELIKRCNEVAGILKQAGFSLRKWMSNSPQLQDEHNLKKNDQILQLSLANNETKTLGIFFNNTTDEFSFKFQISSSEKWTKRSVVSLAVQTFDPLGILTPTTIIPKLIIQQLWKANVEWDQIIPDQINQNWVHYIQNIATIDKLKIRRHVLIENHAYTELHGFADASEKAYGACIYLKSIDKNNKVFINLLTSKSRVAPLKVVTLPRLELCAAALLAQLVDRVKSIVKLNINKEYLWSDSTITLAWIRGEPSRWKAFVSHRVAEIQRVTQLENWYHVKSADNPADLISRGIYPEKLSSCNLWWHGPHWLTSNNYHIQNAITPKELPEEKLQIVRCNVATRKFNIFERFSKLTKLVRTFAYCLRFVNKCKKQKIQSGQITATEYSNSLNLLIKIAQEECFTEEIKELKLGLNIKSNSSILALSPFLDKDGFLRVGGRLKNSSLKFNEKHQLILPRHPITKLIGDFFHKVNLHCGPQQLLYALRQRYWPISGRNLTRGITRLCLKCFKQQPTAYMQFMGQLSSVRIEEAPPVYNTGIDFAGPFKGRDKRSRGYKTCKIYACLFICMTTKAVHLESVGDLSTEAFLAAFTRFVARRGKPSSVYSDNATNFVGANSELNKTVKALNGNSDRIVDKLINQGINVTWNFIPPRSPHHGGIWEANIKGFKRHLTRVSGDMIFTYEEFSTLLAQIEAIINSRPLCPLSEDPCDLNPLIPAHFLIGRPMTSLPEEILDNVPTNRLSIFQRMQKLKQDFWKKWKFEYLNQLQLRNKWKRQNSDILTEGRLVVLVQDSEPPANWKMARITKVWPGKDGIIRVVTVKTSTSTFKRSVTKICVLPMDSD